MTPTPENVFFIVHFNGKVSRNLSGSFFHSERRKCFNMSIKSTFEHLKKRTEEKLKLGDTQMISEILYRAPQSFVGGHVQYNDVEISDNEDVAEMFAAHKSFEVIGIGAIELSVTIENRQTPQPSPLSYTRSFSQTQCQSEPSSSQPLGEIDEVEKKPRLCGLCRHPDDHIRRNCPSLNNW